jgi:hypothetical protein
MHRVIASLLSFPVLLAVSLPAQTSAPPAHGPDGGTQTFVAGIDVLPFTGLPFSATETIVRVRALADGGTITSTLTAKVLRDSQGRLYRERHRFAAADADPQKTLYEFYVLDPSTHTRTDCTIATKQCVVTPYRPRLSFPEMPVGSFDNGKRTGSREALGEKTIEDLNTIGTRETVTLAPGTIGNDKPLNLSRDLWYSPDLKTNIQVVRTDPRDGVITVQLNLQSRSEPDPSNLAVPAGYRVVPPHSPPPIVPTN